MQRVQIVEKLTVEGADSLFLGSIHKYAEKIHKKRSAVLNQEFLVLQAIAIILVVIGHGKGGALTPFSDWFPIYSYHMPLFVFISGYFYKQGSEQHILQFLMKKAKSLLLPYFIWNFVYGLVILLFHKLEWIQYGQEPNLYNIFVEPWLLGQQFSFNCAAWFVLTLFLVQTVYILLQRLFLHVKGKNWLLLCLFTLFGCGVIWYSKTPNMVNFVIALGKILFFLQFYHWGHLYRYYLEERLPKKYFLYLCLFFVIQLFLLKFVDQFNFWVYRCYFPGTRYIVEPILTSFTGIGFWLCIVKLLGPSVQKSKIVRYIGQNTWSVMMHHPIWFFAINCLLWGLSSPLNLSGFNIQAFQTEIWYTYSPGLPQFAIVYVVAGVALPLVVKYGVEKLVLSVDKKFIQKSTDSMETQ